MTEGNGRTGLGASVGQPLDAAGSALTLTAMLQGLAATHLDRLAGVVPGRGNEALTFAELEHQAELVAAGLADLGLSRGDRFAIWLPTTLQWLVLQFAAARLGLPVVALNPRYRVKELLEVLQTAGAAAVALPRAFLGVDFPALLAQVAPELPSLRHAVLLELDDEGRGALPAELPEPVPYAELFDAPDATALEVSPDDLAVIFTTSGTTSSPKLAAHTHRAVVQHAQQVAAAFDLHAGDVSAVALPMAGVFGFSTVLGTLAAGATCRLQPVFDAAELARDLAAGEVSHVNGADNMVVAVLDALGSRPAPRWRDGVFASFSGGGAELVARAQRTAGVRLSGVYGSSEGFALAARWSPDLPIEERARAGGVPISSDIHVRVADPETGSPLSPGEPGELQFRGYNICQEYFANPAASAAAWTADGWFKSGDLGYLLMGEGFVYLSRLKDTLRLRGFLTDPVEIEEFLSTHPAVRLAQVVGVPRAGQGEVPVAFVTLRPGADTDAQTMREYCVGRLANYKVPALVVILDRFPTIAGPNGEKIQKNTLREQAAELLP